MLILGTAGVALAGYLGYVMYPRFDLPAGRGALLLGLAAGTGVASFFSPCSFPLLLTMLAHPPTQKRAGAATWKTWQRLRLAAAVSAGAAIFLLLIGAAMALGAQALFKDVTFDSTAGRIIRAVTGDLLIVLGLIQLGVVRVSLRGFEPVSHRFLAAQSESRTLRPMLRVVLFGFVYLLAGFG